MYSQWECELGPMRFVVGGASQRNVTKIETNFNQPVIKVFCLANKQNWPTQPAKMVKICALCSE